MKPDEQQHCRQTMRAPNKGVRRKRAWCPRNIERSAGRERAKGCGNKHERCRRTTGAGWAAARAAELVSPGTRSHWEV